MGVFWCDDSQLPALNNNAIIKVPYLNELPERCREVFILSRQQNLSNKEIADELGISIQTVKNQISKALGYLRSKLDYITTLLFSSFIHAKNRMDILL